MVLPYHLYGKTIMSTDRRGVTRRPLARIHRIHEALAEESFPNCSSLGAALEVSPKTIQRDLDFMRDEFGMPIEFDTVRNGFHYTQPVQAFPPVRIGTEELMALFVARKVMAPIAGTAVEQALKTGFRRLADLAGASVHISWQDLDQAFSVHEPGMMPTDLPLVEQLSVALVKHQKLFLRYTSTRRRVPKGRVVQPYHLAQFQGGWYLFAFDESVEALRIFALPRMEEVEVLDEGFEPPKIFDLDRYLRGSMGLMTDPEAPELAVRIRFTGYAAVLVAERQWHPSQELRPEENGDVVMQLQLTHMAEVIPWVLGWAGMAEVLEPLALRAEVAARAQDISAQHGFERV